MPVYNAEKYLSETINSIICQTFIDFEFLIIDDGSADGSMGILNSYKDPRIKVFKNNQNIGYVKTLNGLIGLSSGKYIARQDNDDISLPNRLEKQVMFLEKNEDIGLCGTNMVSFGDNRKMTLLPTGDDEIRAYMIISNPIVHPTAMFRRSLFTQMGVEEYDESFCPAEDYAMWFEISKKAKLANLPEALLKYRCHEKNTSQVKKGEQIQKANQIRKRIIESTLSCEISDEEASLLNMISYPEPIFCENVMSLEKVLIKILKKNLQVGYYKDKVIRKIFCYFWMKICFKANNISLSRKMHIYFSSRLCNFAALKSLVSLKYINKMRYEHNI